MNPHVEKLIKLYEEAVRITGGSYKGYTGANALSLYVNDKYGHNAVGETFAGDALCEVMSRCTETQHGLEL